jgi:hypothetical protein
MKLSRGLGLLLVLTLVLSLLLPEVDAAPGRRRALGRRQGQGRGRNLRAKLAGRRKGQGGKRRRRQRRLKRRRTGRWEEGDPPMDPEAAASEPALEAAGAVGEEAGVCEVIMFDRGEGTYSIQFIQNKC